MKKYFYTYFMLSILCFSSFPIQAVSCRPDLFKEKKQPLTLLEELSDPELTVKSTILPHSFGTFVGDEIPIPYILSRWSSQLTEEQIIYSFAYAPPRNRKEKGHIILSFRLNLISGQDYQHWIYWLSDAKNSHLDEDVIRVVFNKVYEEVYGRNLNWMIENHVIPKSIFYVTKQEGFKGIAAAPYISRSKIYDILNIDFLLFRNNKDRLKALVTAAVQKSKQMEMGFSQTNASRMPSDMKKAIQQVTLKEVMGQIIPLQTVLTRFSTSETRKTLDMISLLPADTVNLLTEHRSWREALTSEQVRQIDVNVPGIQYVFAPTFKHFHWVFRLKESINIDTLSDEQIMSFDRDTFLRDVFLAGDLYMRSSSRPPIGVDIREFITTRQEKVKELGSDIVMSGSLSKEVHDFILIKLGFDADFESMTPAERRVVFKKEIEMMTDISQQVGIIEDLVIAEK